MGVLLRSPVFRGRNGKSALWGAWAFLLMALHLVVTVRGDCVMYGNCGRNPNYVNVPCARNITAQKVNGSFEILQNYCPELVTNGQESLTCCHGDQLVDLDQKVGMAAGILSRCPSCHKNLVSSICAYICSPQQSDFTVVTKTNHSESGEQVAEIQVYLTKNYLYGAYNSCKQVSVPSTGNLAMDFMCGAWGSSKCTPERWFAYMGDYGENYFVPFQMDFIVADDTSPEHKPFDGRIVKCNETYDNNTSACSCVDCVESCPAAKPDQTLDYSFNRLLPNLAKTGRRKFSTRNEI